VGKASRNRRRAAAVKARRTRSGSPFWYAATGVIIIVGVIAVALSRGSNDPVPPLANDPVNSHWHAALGVNVCGTWLPNAPEFHERAGSTIRAGLHSHGDGLIHVHPYSSDEAGKNATVGQFFEEGGWELGSDHFRAWDEKAKKNGQKCGDKEATVRWEVNEKKMTGNPASYKIRDTDDIAIAFLPEGEKIGRPPQADAIPTDVPGASTTLPSGASPSSEPPAATAPGDPAATTTAPAPSQTTAAAPTAPTPTTASPPTSAATPTTSAP
jgi:hypothetical protein